MTNSTSVKMSLARQRITDLVKELNEWKKEYDKAENANDKAASREVYNHLCDTLKACNAWLLAYEGEYRLINGIEIGPIQAPLNRIP